MAVRVYLHIGLPKTGTTYLQDQLWANRDRLAEVGIFLPLLRRRQHRHAVRDLIDEERRHLWPGLVDAIGNQRGTAVISEELLSYADDATALRATGDLAGAGELHVIATVRDLSRQIPSAWQQGLKYRAKMTLEAYVNALAANQDHSYWARHDPVKVLRRWAPHIPADRLHLVIVPPVGSPPEMLWQRLTAVLHVAVPAIDGPVRANSSLGAVQSELLRRLNTNLDRGRLPVPDPYLAAIRHGLTPHLARQAALRYGMTEDRTEWVHQRANQQIEGLAEFACNIVGDLEDLRPRTSPSTNPSDTSTDELLTAALTALTDVSENLATVRTELRAERARTRRLTRQLKPDRDDRLRPVKRRLLAAVQ